ncbi:MAG: DNA polymerase III subunit gamma/tau [Acidobacteria bacterium]|nr:DNA polymerase III subunit gamma/tau [Acidobacteriota bacterium]
MSATPATPTPLEGVASLYRRFRPGRFAELRGQDHVVRALQGAVQRDRVSHAYLFSGPRGTGKTTTARILAKALNCERPIEGDACNECDSCRAITRGTSFDVVELDAASNNGVDAMREITAGAWHATPGRWKVYIFDEVHQLSKPASAALLKTLEEPPHHVVFVLATTDPHKVLPTIRSRTQHLEFRLLPGEILHTLLADVSDAAGLAADTALLESAVRLGRGSARDALSALDQLMATGSSSSSRTGIEGVLGALVNSDAATTLREVANVVREGGDPEQMTEDLCAAVRQMFLVQVAPDVSDVVDEEREQLERWGRDMGLARTVRTLETLGRALREMKGAPDKGIVLEVALVRLAHPALDQTLEALAERVERLERQGPVARTPVAPLPEEPRRPIGVPPRVETTPPVTPPVTPPPPDPTPRSVTPSTSPSATPPTSDLDEFRRRFVAHVVPKTSRGAQMILGAAHVVAFDQGRVTIAVANEEIRQSALDLGPGVARALEHEWGSRIDIAWIVGGSPASPTTTPTSAPRDIPVDQDDDEAPEESDPEITIHSSVADHLITEMFPGAEEIS